MRAAVVGHVEWSRFARVERMPRRGEIVQAVDQWEQAGGGGGTAAVQLALLADEVHLFTVLGDDRHGRAARSELEAHGVHVHAPSDPRRTLEVFVHVEEGGERAITTFGEKLLPRGHDDRYPWHELAGIDAVYFASGDVDALRAARKARALVATARELETLKRGSVALDALVGSGEDEGERYRLGGLDPPPALVVSTAGSLGGWMQPGGPYGAAPLPGPLVDTYGAGDCFAAGLAFGLAQGLGGATAVEFAARCGAAAVCGRGVSPQAVH